MKYVLLLKLNLKHSNIDNDIEQGVRYYHGYRDISLDKLLLTPLRWDDRITLEY